MTKVRVFRLNEMFAAAKFGLAFVITGHPAGRIAIVAWVWDDSEVTAWKDAYTLPRQLHTAAHDASMVFLAMYPTDDEVMIHPRFCDEAPMLLFATRGVDPLLYMVNPRLTERTMADSN